MTVSLAGTIFSVLEYWKLGLWFIVDLKHFRGSKIRALNFVSLVFIVDYINSNQVSCGKSTTHSTQKWLTRRILNLYFTISLHDIISISSRQFSREAVLLANGGYIYAFRNEVLKIVDFGGKNHLQVTAAWTQTKMKTVLLTLMVKLLINRNSEY